MNLGPLLSEEVAEIERGARTDQVNAFEAEIDCAEATPAVPQKSVSSPKIM